MVDVGCSVYQNLRTPSIREKMDLGDSQALNGTINALLTALLVQVESR